jgi:hypothetical protein
VTGNRDGASWHGGANEVVARTEQWRAIGATHLSINTMNAGLSSVDDHLAARDSHGVALGLTSG